MNRSLLPLLAAMVFGTTASLYSQQQYMNWEEDTGKAKEPVFLAQADPAPATTTAGNGNQGNTTPAATNGNPADLNGFADTPWKSTYSDTKARFDALARSTTSSEKVEILNAVRNKSLLIKRNDIKYQYSFYKAPFEVVRLTDHQITREEYDQVEAVLYHVKITPIFLDSDMLQKKLEDLYGPRSSTTLDKKTGQGAHIWDLKGGFIFQWHEPYKKHPFTRTIDYISRDVAQKIMEENGDYFDAKEKQILKDLIVG